MVRTEHTPRESLKVEGVSKIIGEGLDPESIRITVVHDKGDKQPIEIEIKKDWYGDVRENFRTAAEEYFIPAIVVELEREIGLVWRDMIGEVIKERDKRITEEIAQRRQQLRADQRVSDTATPEERLETESTARVAGDYRQPIPVRKALFAKPNMIITVFGQITAKGEVHSMVKGGMYQCSRCHTIQYIEYDRPSYPGDDEAPVVMYRMCRDCERERPPLDGQERSRAMQLHRVGIEEKRAVRIELMDTEAYDAVDTLKTVLFDEEAEEVKVGEYAIVRGKLYLVASSRNRRIYRPVLYSHDIRYTNRNTYELKPEDFRRVERFCKQAAQEKDPKTGKALGERNIITRLVWMNGHHVIWCSEAKEAILYAEASAGTDVIGGKGSEGKQRRARINVGLVGNPGLGKSLILRIVLLHDERNRYESAQSSSGKTITAIVSKEGDSSAPTLRVGVLAHAKEAVIAVNELGELSLEEQKYLQDAWEEGQFTVNKHGLHGIIKADAVGVWSSNPSQGASFSKGVISLDQIPIRKQLLDRTDLLIILKPIKDPDKRREFNRLRLDLERANKERKKILSNYDEYVKIHLMVAKRIKPELTIEASEILNEADARIQTQKDSDDLPNTGSNRGLDTLLRLSTVIAKLKLHKEITAEDARYAIEYYNSVTADVQTSVSVPEDPADLACDAAIYILQNEANGLAMTLKTLAELASARDPAIKWYLYQGTKNRLGNVSSNARLRRFRDKLANVSSNKIKQTNTEEAEFLWVGGKGGTEEEEEGEKEKDPSSSTNVSKNTDTADTADKTKPTREAKNKTPGHDTQTKMSQHVDTPKTKSDSQVQNTKSAVSVASAKHHKIPLEEKEDKVLMACGMAMSDYSDDKVQNKESGAMFETYGVWYHLTKTYPDDDWTTKKVYHYLDRLQKKGRVLTRQGDTPDRWYLLGGGEGGATQ
jgi:DNA replicative helicase MCM subunit Mcm2 (Cdc46/Mcm family)